MERCFISGICKWIHVQTIKSLQIIQRQTDLFSMFIWISNIYKFKSFLSGESFCLFSFLSLYPWASVIIHNECRREHTVIMQLSCFSPRPIEISHFPSLPKWHWPIQCCQTDCWPKPIASKINQATIKPSQRTWHDQEMFHLWCERGQIREASLNTEIEGLAKNYIPPQE